jgi:hypothetical protein
VKKSEHRLLSQMSYVGEMVRKLCVRLEVMGSNPAPAHAYISKRRTRVGIARLASRLSRVRSPGIRPMKKI